ncbi:bis(5'-nucleosyl)-tetraphosphatase (symmetrical) YqeK [Ureaplasma diversum]|uniref:Probable nicotinate-nucleotide adenylyltransferase n=1 Tax=Ureaplasma diversum NCTC 246 TaxID=1188241 RepID=A0A084F1F6_9BACT|nr:bis(5'-nucleosyl)-tetraphosphatase (symmetrical) YqeK [Ureaplasma diversum]KEZ24048.1 nicotinate-nucleotide adenylyltransferase [Ureaplasma diversum NCTC 246]
MKYLLFHGTFDMFHNGHLAILKKAISLDHYDQIIITPSNTKFFLDNYNLDFVAKKKQLLSIKEDRVHMIKASIKDLAYPIQICDYELNQVSKAYSIDTINYYYSTYGNNNDYYFIIGSDQVANLKDWKDIESIVCKVTFLCFLRNKDDKETIASKLDQLKCNYSIIDFDVDISSTVIKQVHQPDHLVDEVFDFINDNGLYAIYLLEKYLINESDLDDQSKNINRIKHCYRVGEYAHFIMLHYDQSKARLAYSAGVYHDILKKCSEPKTLAYFKQHQKELKINDFVSWRVLHANNGAHLLQTKYHFKNQELINAIARHTRPFDYNSANEISLLDKVLYCADKLEPARMEGIDLDNIDHYRNLVLENIDQAFIEIYEQLQNKEVK